MEKSPTRMSGWRGTSLKIMLRSIRYYQLDTRINLAVLSIS